MRPNSTDPLKAGQWDIKRIRSKIFWYRFRMACAWWLLIAGVILAMWVLARVIP